MTIFERSRCTRANFQLVGIALFVTATLTTSHRAIAQIYEPGSTVLGQTIGGWWNEGVRLEIENGVEVFKGSQPGPVFTLPAGDAYGGSGTFDVPAGAPILASFFGSAVWNHGGQSANRTDVINLARRIRPIELSFGDVALTSADLQQHLEVGDTPILLNGDPNAWSAGWAVMIEPLPPGQHMVKRVVGGEQSWTGTATINVFELATESLAVGQTYKQDFDSLGTDGISGTALPNAWTVTDKNAFNIYKHETNAEFPAPSRFRMDGPHVFNAGSAEAKDRTLAVYRESRSTGATVQFLASSPPVDTNALRLDFAMEVWDKVRGTTEGTGLFDVSVDIDRGEGFAEFSRLGVFETSTVVAAEGFEYVDGNSEANRLVASEIITGNIPADSQLRFRWKATHRGRDASREMVFGIDDVGITLAAAGDANFDGLVDFSDFLTVSNNFGQPGGWTQGDFDGNGETNFPDFLILSENFGSSAAASAAAVPEPGTFSLGAFAIIGLLRLRRR